MEKVYRYYEITSSKDFNRMRIDTVSQIYGVGLSDWAMD